MTYFIHLFVARSQTYYKYLVTHSFFPEGKRPLGRPRRRWEDGIRMDLTLGRLAGRMLSGFNWLRIGASGGML
jgi:hypothetical protein